MKFKVITIGKLKNKNLSLEVESLKKRISRLEIIELKEVSDKNVDIIKKKEFNLIKPVLKNEDLNVLLIENGKEFSTKEFYDKYKSENRTICFIITGAYGPGDDLRNLVDFKLSLSKMTFTHEQAFYMLVEQLYRMDCFDKGIKYNK